MQVNLNIDLENDSIFSLFRRYFFPMLVAMLTMASYSTVDGIFISKKLGDEAMSAIAVVWSIFPFNLAIALLFSLGGSSLIGFYLAKKRNHLARVIFSSIIYLVFPLSVTIGIVFYFNTHLVVGMMVNGVGPHIQYLSEEYMKGIFIGLFALFLHPILDMFVVNDKRPNLAMVAMIVGAVVNVVFNYLFLFILEIGIVGSAYATILGHFIGALILFRHYLSKRGDLYFVKAFSFTFILRSMKFGSPYAVSELGSAFTMLLYAKNLKFVEGDAALSIYSALNYAGFIYFTIILALAESLQPMVSFNFGLRNFKRLKQILRFYIVSMLIVSVFLYIIFFILRRDISLFFLQNAQLQNSSVSAMAVYYIAFIFMGFNMLFSLYFQSMQRFISSFLITIGYTILFISIFLYPLSIKFGVFGSWISYPISQLCALIVSICTLFYEFRFGIFSKRSKYAKCIG